MRHEERFWAKVDKSGGLDTCWEWLGGKINSGYGQFRVNGKMVLAHRFAYELEHGSIPKGLCACHRCDNRGCANPNHIFLGTHADNAADRENKGRGNQVRGERHGSRTHPENRPRGERHWGAKLTAEQVAEIRALYTTGSATQCELGRRFGVHHTQIGRVVRGKKWKTEGHKT